jgi:murein DD-endopeptidase MepM/ murein hydrolase activator NlpD
MKNMVWVRLLLMTILSIAISGCATHAPMDAASSPDPGTLRSSPLPVTSIPATLTPDLSPDPPLDPTVTPSQSMTEIPLETQLACGEILCQIEWPGYLIRPISGEYRNTIDPIYPYANTKGGILEVHHGVEFPNASGTPVRAAAGGEVIFAGTDDLTLLGPYTDFYGNVVILHHPELYQGRDLFTLYAHLSEIDVAEGDWLTAGQVLGKVGASGAADGSHLHFEVRLDENAYERTTNPVLWFEPVQAQEEVQAALLAGQIMDRFGTPLPEFEFVLMWKSAVDGQPERDYPITYVSYSVNAHPLLNENFVVPDLPPGVYQLSFIAGRFYQFDFTLQPGKLGFIRVQLD